MKSLFAAVLVISGLTAFAAPSNQDVTEYIFMMKRNAEIKSCLKQVEQIAQSEVTYSTSNDLGKVTMSQIQAQAVSELPCIDIVEANGELHANPSVVRRN